jgi:hypothetical protein
LFFSSTSLDVASALAKSNKHLSSFSSSSSNWHKKLSSTLMKFSLLETKEFIEDFNQHNNSNTQHTTITPEVAEIFRNKTDGYVNSFFY